MRTRFIAIPILVALGLLGLASRARSATDFIIQNADATSYIAVLSSSQLEALFPSIAPRFVSEHANSMKFFNLGPLDSELKTLIGQVGRRFVLNHANANQFINLVYPVPMVHDSAPPQVSQATASTVSSDTVKLVVTLTEYATLSLEYGVQSGAYTQFVTDDLYSLTREITLTGLTRGQTYYYRYTGADRSGNIFESQEYTFIIQNTRYLYIPIILNR